MTSIKAYLYERTVSPLLGALTVSWCIWNYRFFFLATSELKYADKMAEIDRFYQSTTTYSFYNLFEWTISHLYSTGILFPLSTALLYLFVFPYPSEWVFRFSLARSERLAKIKNTIEDNKLLSIEQSREIRLKLAETERVYDEEIERKNRAIESRDRRIEELEAQIGPIQTELDESNATLEALSAALKERLKDEESQQASMAEITRMIQEGASLIGDTEDSEDLVDETEEDPITEVEQIKEPETEGGNLSKDIDFYLNAPKDKRELYNKILTGLYLEERRRSELKVPTTIVDDLILDLNLAGFIKSSDSQGKYRITDEGRDFVKRIKKLI